MNPLPRKLLLLPARVPEHKPLNESPEEPSHLQMLPRCPTEQKIASPSFLRNTCFREGMSLIFSIERAAAPLIIQPAPLTIIGRTNQGASEASIINLSPYDGRARGVSRIHALLHRTKHNLAIEDANSSNGTFINGRRLKSLEPHVLQDGDVVSLGLLVIRVTFHQVEANRQ